LRTKLSVSVLAQRKIESARPRKHGLFLRAEEKMRLYGRTLASASRALRPPTPMPAWSPGAGYSAGPSCLVRRQASQSPRSSTPSFGCGARCRRARIIDKGPLRRAFVVHRFKCGLAPMAQNYLMISILLAEGVGCDLSLILLMFFQ
jgi:hypothetical protein